MSNSHLPIPPIPTEDPKAAKTPQTPKPPQTPKTHAEVKAARLQAALRENLRRRKAANVASPEANAPDHEKANPNES